MLRTIAILLVIAGILGACFAFNMSITAPGTTIGNLPRMAERQNILLVAAVIVLAGTILFAADLVRGGTPPIASAQRGDVSGRGSHIHAYWWICLRWTIISLAVLALVRMGIYWQSEVLSFGPFWALTAWRVWKAYFGNRRSPIYVTTVILVIAFASLVVMAMFLIVNEPPLPQLNFNNTVEQVNLDFANYRVALNQFYAHHGMVVFWNALVVFAGSVFLLIFLLVFLVARHISDRLGKVPFSLEQSEPLR